MVIIHDVEQGSDEWHQLRAGKYTGSNAHKLLKYGARAYSLTEGKEFGGNFWTKRGHLLEEEAIELYERIKGVKVERVGFVTNDKFPDCGYSPDGLREKEIIEVKCFDEPRHLRLLAGDIPLEIMAQVQFGMMICERRISKLVLYNPKLEPTKALKIIEVRGRAAITSNFKRILKSKETMK
jgi:hypothetical protein